MIAPLQAIDEVPRTRLGWTSKSCMLMQEFAFKIPGAI